MKENSSSESCPRCGAVMPEGAPEGLCPKCLLSAAAAPTEASPDVGRMQVPELKVVQTAFPHLEIIELIGQGGMGLVYKARQPKLNRIVAVKLLPHAHGKGEAFAARFAREARALAALNHPNIVTVHDYGESGEFFYLLMEMVDGVNLRQALQAGGISPEQALAIVPQICEALQFAHDRGIVHRDIKPENLLLNKDGRLKIADFGIATLLELPDAEDGTPAGTPRYAAPEQMADPLRADHRADIFSLGVVFYELLTGQMPPQPIEPPSRKVQIDVRLDEVVLRALEKSPNLRWQTAAEMGTRVETIASESGASRRTPEYPAGGTWSAILALSAPAAVFAWFVLFGHRLFGFGLDADAVFWLSQIGFPISTGVGVLLAGATGVFKPRFPSLKEGRWGTAPILGPILFVLSIFLMGGGLIIAQLISHDNDYNPAPAELIFVLIFLGGGIVASVAATLLGWHILRQVRRGPATRGWRGGWAMTWFWPAVAAGIALLYLPTRLAGDPDAGLNQSISEAEMQRTEALRRVMEAQLNALPPVVVGTYPPSGATGVGPGIPWIRVNFNKPMAPGSWSWVEAWPGSTPEIVGEPYFEGDRSCLVRVKMEPGRTYAWWINSDTFQNFRDRNGTPAVPYLLIFETQPAIRNGAVRPE